MSPRTNRARTGRSPLRLTPRERQVLALLGHGLDNATIAEHLCISRHTLQHHLTAIYAKLGGVSRPQAVVFAIRQGLAGPPPRAG